MSGRPREDPKLHPVPSSFIPIAAQIQTDLRSAVWLHQRGQLAEAEKMYRTILKMAPDHFNAMHFLGIVLFQRGQLVEGEQLIARALKINPRDPSALNNHGNVLQGLTRFNKALASYDEAIALKPDYADAYNNRGNTLQALERFDEALASYDKAIALKPDYADAFNNRGTVLLRLERYAEQLASCDRAISLAPNSVPAHSNRAWALFHLSRYSEALASCDRAIGFDAGYSDAWIARSNILAELKRLDTAPAAGDEPSNPIPFFVLHYSPETARRAYIEREWREQAERTRFDIQFITEYDQEDSRVSSPIYDENTCRRMMEAIKDKQIGYFLSQHNLAAPFNYYVEQQKLKNSSLDQDIIAYPHLKPARLLAGEMSLILKHREAWIQIANGASDYAVVAEDDIIFNRSSLRYLLDLIQRIPSDADYIDIARGIPSFKPRAGNTCANDHFFKMHPPKTRTTCAAILSRSFARRIVELNPPLCLTSDWLVDWIFAQLDTKLYWVEPTVFGHGSQMNVYKTLFPKRSM